MGVKELENAKRTADTVLGALQEKKKEGKKDLVQDVLRAENITTDTRLEDMLSEVSAAKIDLEAREKAEKKLRDLGVPTIEPPSNRDTLVFPSVLSDITDEELGIVYGNYMAWIAYLRHLQSIRETDVLMAKSSQQKIVQLLTKKWRSGGTKAEAEQLVRMDSTLLALGDLIMEFLVELRLVESRLKPFQDYAKALSREISRRGLDNRYPGYGNPGGDVGKPDESGSDAYKDDWNPADAFK